MGNNKCSTTFFNKHKKTGESIFKQKVFHNQGDGGVICWMGRMSNVAAVDDTNLWQDAQLC